jgi:hypothetical protein
MTTGPKPSSWKRCGVCKRDLGFEADFYECSVSTCTTGRNHPVFCSVTCWEQHVPVMRHRDAWAEQKRSPSRDLWEQEQALFSAAVHAPTAAPGPAPRRIVVAGPASSFPAPAQGPAGDETLVVASKLKAWIKARAGMNTSESVLEELSDIVREHVLRAIDNARADGRKTVMDRDFRPR